MAQSTENEERGPVSHVVRCTPTREPRREPAAVTAPFAAMVAKGEPRNDPGPPAVRVCLEHVDPVPSHPLLEGRHLLQARGAVCARGSPDVIGGHVAFAPLSVVFLEAGPACDAEPRVGVERL